MALHSDLPIYKSTYDLTILVKKLVRNFPRSYRQHGVKLDEECLELTVQIFRANSAKNKWQPLSELVERLQVVNLLLRLSCDLQLIGKGQYAEAIQLTGSVGRQATAWKKSSAPPAG